MIFEFKDNSICFTREGETGRLSACGRNAVRFQATASAELIEQDFTLMPIKTEASVWQEGNCAYLRTGDTKVKMDSYGRVQYFYKDREILSEQYEMTFHTGIRNYENIGSGLWKIRLTFNANSEEAFYGLGHEAVDCFNKKGCAFDLRHVNTKATVPYVYSSLGYGFIFNMPSTGTVELANNRTRFVSDCAKQLDYVVIGGTPRETAAMLADLTGHAPLIPEWALGLWQSRLRYETQEEVLSVAHRYKQLGIPLSVIVIDYFHWTEQGDYRFDKRYWPNPKEMADELHRMGIKLMVSVWPTINEKSENYGTMLKNNMLIRTKRGSNRVFDFYGPQAEIDATNPKTREFVFKKLKENYLDLGVDCLWFDEAEPEIHPEHFDNLLLYLGNGEEVALLYPYYYSKLVYDGMKAEGLGDIVILSRSAYLGTQKFGSLIWSGDIESTFESLTAQVKSGLNMAMCGIPWWTTDIGGFYGGDIHSDYFKELIVRWFQYGVFCPVLRLHGSRNGKDFTRDIIEPTGAPNELWSFGEENLSILKELVELRYRLIPYIKKGMEGASECGVPVMRPLFFDYSSDKHCYEIGDEYLFGDDILFAPITKQGQTLRKVYLPKGSWVLTKDMSLFEGEAEYEVKAELDEYIAFVRRNAEVLKVWEK